MNRPIKRQIRENIAELHKNPENNTLFDGWSETAPNEPDSRIFTMRSEVGEAILKVTNKPDFSSLLLKRSVEDGSQQSWNIRLDSAYHGGFIMVEEEQSFSPMQSLFYGVVFSYNDHNGGQLDGGGSQVFITDQGKKNPYKYLGVSVTDDEMHNHFIFERSRRDEFYPFGEFPDLVKPGKDIKITKKSNQGFPQKVAINVSFSSVEGVNVPELVHTTLDISRRHFLINKPLRTIHFSPLPLRLTPENLSQMFKDQLQNVISK